MVTSSGELTSSQRGINEQMTDAKEFTDQSSPSIGKLTGCKPVPCATCKPCQPACLKCQKCESCVKCGPNIK